MKRRLMSGLVTLITLVCAHAGATSMQMLLSVDSLYQQGQTLMAPDWKPLGKANGAAVFVHHGFRKADKSHIAAWIDRELVLPEYFNKEKPYLSIRERELVECKSGRVGHTESSFYSEHFGRGMIVGVNREEDLEMRDAVPDSIEDRLMKVACASQPQARTVHRAKKAPRKAATKKEKTKEKTKKATARKTSPATKKAADENKTPL